MTALDYADPDYTAWAGAVSVFLFSVVVVSELIGRTAYFSPIHFFVIGAAIAFTGCAVQYAHLTVLATAYYFTAAGTLATAFYRLIVDLPDQEEATDG